MDIKDFAVISIGIFIGMGLYEIMKAIANKIQKRAFATELKKLTENNFIDTEFKIIIERKRKKKEKVEDDWPQEIK